MMRAMAPMTITTDAYIANPFSAGGGGTAFEQRVAATYLVSILREQVPRGLGAGTAYSVRFQARQEGVPLDDLLVVSFDGDVRRHLALQIKHKLTFSSKDRMFREVLMAAWATYQSAQGWRFQRDSDRLGIGIGVMTLSVREYLVPLLDWARACLTADEFAAKVATPQFAHDQKRAFRDVFRSVLTDVAGHALSDEELWTFFRHLVVLDFDLEYEGSRDAAVAWNALLDLAPDRDTARACDAFQLLVAKVGEWAPKAATVSGDAARGAVASVLSLPPSAPALRTDLRRLDAQRARAMDRMRDNLAGAYHLPRTGLLEDVQTALDEADVVFITGEPGSGKSGVLRSLARRLEAEGQPLLVRADQLDYPTLEDFAYSLGLQQPFDDLLDSLSAPARRCLLIDGLERWLTLERKGCMHDLISTVVAHNRRLRLHDVPSGACWKIVCTCRAHLVEPVVDELPPLAEAALAGVFRTVAVGPLTQEEMEEVQAVFPAVRALWPAAHLRNLLRLPLYLDIITRQGLTFTAAQVRRPATETWFAEQFWSAVVRRREGGHEGTGSPQARERAMLDLAERSLARGWIGAPVQDVPDPAAVEGLAHDMVLREEDAAIIFAHDVFGDWALYKLLAQPGRDVVTLVEEHGEPRALDRPVQLLACRLLERSHDADSWQRLLHAVGSRTGLSLRWRHLVLNAPLFSGRLRELLPRLEPLLLADDGELLDQLLVALTTGATEPDPTTALLYRGVAPEEIEHVLPYLRVPLPSAWTPMLELLVRLGSAIPAKALLHATDVVRMWMEKTQPGAPLRREVAHLAFSLLFADEEESEED